MACRCGLTNDSNEPAETAVHGLLPLSRSMARHHAEIQRAYQPREEKQCPKVDFGGRDAFHPFKFWFALALRAATTAICQMPVHLSSGRHFAGDSAGHEGSKTLPLPRRLPRLFPQQRPVVMPLQKRGQIFPRAPAIVPLFAERQRVIDGISRRQIGKQTRIVVTKLSNTSTTNFLVISGKARN